MMPDYQKPETGQIVSRRERQFRVGCGSDPRVCGESCVVLLGLLGTGVSRLYPNTRDEVMCGAGNRGEPRSKQQINLLESAFGDD